MGLPIGSVVSSNSEPATPGDDVDVGCGILAPTSFFGGVGACSADEDGAAGADSVPRGPRGSNESSTASSFVDWTSILRAGIFRDEEGRGPLLAGFEGVGASG